MLLFFALTACDNPDTLTLFVGPDGATATSESVTLTVPPGAVDDEVTIEFDETEIDSLKTSRPAATWAFSKRALRRVPKAKLK